MHTDMREIITIKKPIIDQNTFGEPVVTWDVVHENIFASVEPLIGKEYYAAKSIQSEAEYKIKTYYLADLDSSMIVEHGTKIYKIITPPQNVKSYNRQTVLMCKELIKNA